jgi:DNA-binding transcriptional MerR regulator
MDTMTVGEAARAVGVSTKAIRVWESRGLIPAAERTAAGYRAFTAADLDRLHFIRQAKTLGLTLNEIGSVIAMQHAGASPCDRVRQAIDSHLTAIDRKMADLMQLREALTIAKDTSQTTCTDDRDGTVCHIIERIN